MNICPSPYNVPMPMSFFWDQWKVRADSAGMRSDVATAGRALIRECDQHQWENFLGPGIRTICGFADNGDALLAFGLSHPDFARRIWEYLTIDDAGNNPRPPKLTKDIRYLTMWIFSRLTWPIEWPQ